MTQYLKKMPKTRFNQPPSSVLRGKKVPVPSLYGMSRAAAVKKLEKAGFTVENAYVYSDQPKGTALGWSPGPGSMTPQYGTIYWTISKGRDPAVVQAEKQARAEADRQAREAKKKAAEERKKKKKGKGGG